MLTLTSKVLEFRSPNQTQGKDIVVLQMYLENHYLETVLAAKEFKMLPILRRKVAMKVQEIIRQI